MTHLLEVRDLTAAFSAQGGWMPAVREVGFVLERGEVVGLVGESGCGKSVTALSLMRLLPDPPGRILNGSVLLAGEDIVQMREPDLRRVRGGRIAMVFQDPFSCLNPTMSLGDQIMEAIQAHAPMNRHKARERAMELLRSVHMPSPEMRMRQYPHQVSGGQRQRVMIAVAFAGNPELIIADEPTTALDVTVQAQVLALMLDLRSRTNAAILLITHDLGIVAETCDRMLVMYAGRIVEEGTTASVFRRPLHPYTQGLLASLPSLSGPRVARLPSIPGQPPALAEITSGCAFAERCPRAMDVCRATDPERLDMGEGAAVRCHLYSAEGRAVKGEEAA
jgi:oligopeptide/dipeptide ABC transporter ATP-binding protein